MSKPTKIPINYALAALNSSNRGYENPQDDVLIRELQMDGVNDNQLVPVSKLRKHFANKRSFDAFKENLSVPESFWSECQTPESKRYAKKFQTTGKSKRGRPRTKKRNRVIARIGYYSDDDAPSDADSETSVISIIPSDDDSEPYNPNFPMPVCKGIRRVCRVYDKSRRYMPYKKDSSDNDQYHLNVSYKKSKK